MSQAKQPHESAADGHWLHGTNEYFAAWAQPPVTTIAKPELLPHPFVSLTKDKALAVQAGNVADGLCHATLAPNAKVLDLRTRSGDTERVWKMVCASDFGQKHREIQSLKGFLRACADGTVLRMASDDETFLAPYVYLMQQANNSPLQRARIEARLKLNNFTRQWINQVIEPAAELGYDAVICAEIDSHRAGGPQVAVNLYVFDTDKLSAPEWLSRPDPAKLQQALAEVRKQGF